MALIAKISSSRIGENIKINPYPFTSPEKLDTQNGIKKSRNDSQ